MQFTLDVTDRSSRRSRLARQRLEDILAAVDTAFIDVVDVRDDPDTAERARIVATPTVVRDLPLPPMRIVGDLADGDLVRAAFGLGAVRVANREMVRGSS